MNDGVWRFMFFMLALALTGGGIYLMIMLLHVLQRKLTGGAQGSAGELEELHDRVAELEGQVGDLVAREPEQHLAELEERLEFAERLLANAGNRAVLPEPSDEVTARSEGANGRSFANGWPNFKHHTGWCRTLQRYHGLQACCSTSWKLKAKRKYNQTE